MGKMMVFDVDSNGIGHATYCSSAHDVPFSMTRLSVYIAAVHYIGLDWKDGSGGAVVFVVVLVIGSLDEHWYPASR